MKNSLIFWAATLAAYAVILGATRSYEVSSFIYHLMILTVPLYLLLMKKQRLSLGLVKGDVKNGLFYTTTIIALLIILMLIRRQSFRLLSPVGDPISFTVTFILTALLAPFSEELLHRGYIQPKIKEKFNTNLGILFTALLFSAIHIPKLLFTNMLAPESLVLFLALGLMFSYVKEESKSTAYPIIMHMAWNTILM